MTLHMGSGSLISLRGRTALVTGGGGAIGGRTAEVFLEAEALVHCADLPGREGPAGAMSHRADLSNPAEVKALLQDIGAEEEGLDILVHAAGITRDGVLWKMKDESWREVLSVNLDSAFYLLREAVPLLRGSSHASVVMISSINGERGKFGQSNYAASKAGLIGLAKTAARELGPKGVRVNVLAPGLIETPMTSGLPEEILAKAEEETALGRLGQPEDVARVALFLASDLSRHVTGQVIRVDGGQLIV